MTTRLKGLTVVFEHDIREDDAEHIVNAIRMIRGVLKVLPVETTTDDIYVEERVRRELYKRVFAALDPTRKEA